jgi:hypothetical protein
MSVARPASMRTIHGKQAPSVAPYGAEGSAISSGGAVASERLSRATSVFWRARAAVIHDRYASTRS